MATYPEIPDYLGDDKLLLIESYLKFQLDKINKLRLLRTTTPKAHLLSELIYQTYRDKNDRYNCFKRWIRINLKKYVLFECKNPNSEGVYLIENFYIGKSKNIKQRIIGHLVEALLDCVNLDHRNYNYIKSMAIIEVLNKRRLKIVRLDHNKENEKELIIKFANIGYPLINKQFNPNYKKIEL